MLEYYAEREKKEKRRRKNTLIRNKYKLQKGGEE